MALPKTQKLQFPVTLPSGISGRISPYTGKAEKALLGAKATRNESIILETSLNVLSDCCEGFRVHDLIQCDFEAVFLKAYEISVSDEINTGFKCNKCEHITYAKIPTKAIKFPEDVQKEYKVDVGEDAASKQKITAIMNNPTMSNILDVSNISENQELALMWRALSGIYVGSEKAEIESEKEFTDWVLDQQHLYSNLLMIISNLPSITFEREWKCDKCGTMNKIKLRGLSDFFTS